MVALSLDRAPPFGAPLRFFVTAPLYGFAAGVLVCLRAETIVQSRWSFDTLAVVHLLVLGFMLQVMAGALLQLLPVAAGAAVAAPRLTAALTHSGLNAGTVLLVAAFLGAGQPLFAVAAAVLLAALSAFLVAVGVGLWRSPAVGPTLLALKAAALGLAVTVALGFTLASALSLGWAIPFADLVRVHAAWGLLGFALCLLAAVATLVVPMFQLTPAYPLRLQRALPAMLVTGLLAWSVGVPLHLRALEVCGAAVLAAAAATFAGYTLGLFARRKRRVRDATFWSWRLGLVSLLAATGTALAAFAAPEGSPALEYLTGALVLGGAFPAFIAGMLYKIVPFLVWLHRSRQGPDAPMMNEVLGASGPRAQLLTQALALALLLAGAAAPAFATAGGLLLALSQLLLELNLLAALRVYRHGGRTRAERAPGEAANESFAPQGAAAPR